MGRLGRLSRTGLSSGVSEPYTSREYSGAASGEWLARERIIGVSARRVADNAFIPTDHIAIHDAFSALFAGLEVAHVVGAGAA